MPIFGANLNVIGNKLQDESFNTIFGILHGLDEHFHSKSEVYPELSDPIQLQKASGAWAAYPTPTEIIPASAIGDTFDIHWISISGISANGDYTLKLYSGAALSEVEIATIDFTRNAVQSQEGAQPNQDIIVPANTRISAAISDGNAGQDTCKVKVRFHRY